MKYKTINTNSLLKKITRTDDLFKGEYTVDPYQNCEIACAYCDSSFEKKIFIKNNSIEILDEELKKIENNGRIIIGSVHDPYQPIEKDIGLTRRILEKIQEYGFSCHILTKSDLIYRDLDLIKNMDDCMITISISSLNEKIINIFEKNAVNPSVRLKTLEKISKTDIFCGLAIIPFFPYIMDDELESIINTVSEIESNYVLLKALELRGDLKKCVFEKIKIYFPDYYSSYNTLYEDSFLAKKVYLNRLYKKFNLLCKNYGLNSEIKK